MAKCVYMALKRGAYKRIYLYPLFCHPVDSSRRWAVLRFFIAHSRGQFYFFIYFRAYDAPYLPKYKSWKKKFGQQNISILLKYKSCNDNLFARPTVWDVWANTNFWPKIGGRLGISLSCRWNRNKNPNERYFLISYDILHRIKLSAGISEKTPPYSLLLTKR